MRFLCDQMLVKLGRWLRIAGYDTEIVTRPCKDREILDQALEEDRFLISRDRHFLEFRKGQEHILWLGSNHLEPCIQELNRKAAINWIYRPFSRCSLCNTELQNATKEQIRLAPEEVQKHQSAYWFCPQCKKLYWQGSHTDKMLKQLDKWNDLKPQTK